jgi:hypothetical protein
MCGDVCFGQESEVALPDWIPTTATVMKDALDTLRLYGEEGTFRQLAKTPLSSPKTPPKV